MPRIGFIVTYEDMYEKVKSIVKESSEVEVRVGLLSKSINVARDLIKEGVEVLISRGGTTEYLMEEFPHMPVADVELSSYDIAKAVHEAKKISNNIAIVFFKSMQIDVDLSDLFDCNIKMYYVAREKDAAKRILEASNDGYEVIIGGEIIQRISRHYGFKSILVESGTDAILNSINQAKQILISKDEANKNLNLIKSVVENTDVGIIAVNKSNKVIIINRKATELIGSRRDKIIGQKISTYFAVEDMDDGDSAIFDINQQSVLVTKRKQLSDSIGISEIFTVEKSSEINDKERSIRSTYVNRGYKAGYHFDNVKGKSAKITEIVDILKKYAKVDSTLLIQGETGTGKELFAQSVHNYSKRKGQPFVAVNCASLTESLLESELFGYAKWAFTGASQKGKLGLFEIADGGTIFLDEVGEISPVVQAKLLRVIQEREVMRIGDDRVIPIDVRIIAATNRNLIEMVDKGDFRRDLYFRLSVLKVNIPALRERKSDIKILFQDTLEYFSSKLNLRKPEIDEECFKDLCKYDWPGNIRELRNLVERLIIVYEGKYVLPEMMRKLFEFNFKPSVEDLDIKDVLTVLKRNGNNKTKTAKELGISRTTLWKILKEMGM